QDGVECVGRDVHAEHGGGPTRAAAARRGTASGAGGTARRFLRGGPLRRFRGGGGLRRGRVDGLTHGSGRLAVRVAGSASGGHPPISCWKRRLLLAYWSPISGMILRSRTRRARSCSSVTIPCFPPSHIIW